MQSSASAFENLGPYRVLRELTGGGPSKVLLATNVGADAVGIERTVVLKVLPEQFATDLRLAKTFAREAAAYGRLEHPAIVRLHDVLQLEGLLVMVVEHVDGASLSRTEGMLRAVGAELDDVAALHIGAEMFAALAAAHGAKNDTGAQAPVMHRYLSPSSVLIGWDGRVKVGDFSLPRTTGANLEGAAAAIAMGSDGYMAPEQLSGKEVLPRSDVYAAAIILWELLAKKRAFARTKRRVDMWRAMAEPRLDPIATLRPDIDPRVAGVLRRALEPRVEKRNVTAKEIAIVLRDLVSEERGKPHLADIMSKVRHEPSPLPSEPPAAGAEDASAPLPSGQRVAVKSSTSTDAEPKPTASRERLATSTASDEPSPPKRISSGKLTAVGPRRISSAKLPAVVPGRVSSTKIPTPAVVKRRAPLPPPSTDTARTVPPPARPEADLTPVVDPEASRPVTGAQPIRPVGPLGPMRPRDPSSFELVSKELVVDLREDRAPPPRAPEDVSVEVTPSIVEPPPATQERSVEVDVSVVAPAPAEPRAVPEPEPPAPRRSGLGSLLLLAVVLVAALIAAARMGWISLLR